MTDPAVETLPPDTAKPSRWRGTVFVVVLALIISTLVRVLLVQVFYVPSGSMENTLQVNDRIAVSKLGSVNRGDVVVFQDPGNWLEGLPALTPVQHALSFVGLYPTGGDLVKRVVGVGGDEVKCCSKDGKIVVNGVPMDEKAYINANEGTSQVPFDVKVPMGSIFVLGDNRAHSADSRFHLDVDKGMVPLSNVVGVVKWIIWPLSRAGSVPASVPLSGLPSSKAS